MLRRPTLWERLSFKKKLMLFSLLFSLIPVLLLGSAASFLASTSIQSEVNAKHELALRQISDQVDSVLKRMEYLSIQIANDVTIEKSVRLGITMDQLNALEATLEMLETIAKYRSYSDVLFHVFLVYNRYDMVYSNRLGLLKPNEFPYGGLMQGGKIQSTGARILPPNTYPNQRNLLIVRPIGQSGTDGTLVMEVDMSSVYTMLRGVDLGNGSKVQVVNSDGRIVLSQNEAEIGTPLPVTLSKRLQTAGSPYTTTLTLDEESVHLSSHRSAFNDWSYLILTPSANLTVKSQQIRNLTWLLAACVALLWAIIALFASHRLYVPIQTLLKRLPMLQKPTAGGLAELDQFMQHMLEANDRLADELRQKMPALRENLLLQLLRGDVTEAEFGNQSKRYGLSLPGPAYTVCVFEIDHLAHYMKRSEDKDRSLMMVSMSLLIAELGGQSPAVSSCVTVNPRTGQTVLLLSSAERDESGMQTAKHLCGLIRHQIKELFPFTVTAVVSRPCYQLSGIREAYQEALDLLPYRLLLGRDITVTSAASEQLIAVHQSTRTLVKRQKAIVKLLAEGSTDSAIAEFHGLLQELPQIAPAAKSVLGLFTNLLAEIDHGLEPLGLDLSDLLSLKAYTRINEAESLDEVRDWFLNEFFPAFRNRFESLHVSPQTKTVQQVLDYIHESAEQELSLQEAARMFRLSPSQLSRMFKEAMGLNFIDYVIEHRMSRAKEWLAHSDMPIKDIAERLQYTNTQNFSRAFKQCTGKSPGQYRDWSRGAIEPAMHDAQ
ncbi:helix-turn-helix domain-containing protein [Paenibacillus sp. HJGM_3]|uniref:helix-turn-helix domain-containing protein n=1 Tax=Paenibacillus sp. HJGM_3 TaxID=3379816 RepID=UPI00385D6C71